MKGIVGQLPPGNLGCLAMVVLISACVGKDEVFPAPTTTGCGTLHGIVQRDLNGVPMGPTDTTDWGHTDAWCPAVEALFSDLAPVTWQHGPPDSLFIAAWPNPTQDQFILGFYRTDTGYVDLRIVDAQHNLIGGFDSLLTHQYLFHAQLLGITAPQYLRAYYRVVHPDGSAHRGHGDIRIQ